MSATTPDCRQSPCLRYNGIVENGQMDTDAGDATEWRQHFVGMGCQQVGEKKSLASMKGSVRLSVSRPAGAQCEQLRQTGMELISCKAIRSCHRSPPDEAFCMFPDGDPRT